jgi:bifunctional DNase/RNase
MCFATEIPKPEAKPDQVRVEKVEVRASAVGPVVLLRVGNKAIPVFIDAVVAESIQGALGGQKPARPLSHDLMHSILEGMGARVAQVVVTLKGQIFYADVTVVSGSTTKVFDSRTSDAVALAVAAKAAGPAVAARVAAEALAASIRIPMDARIHITNRAR